MPIASTDEAAIRSEIAELEHRLRDAQSKLPHVAESIPAETLWGSEPKLHALLLLTDSALPLGSFAFSSGLESFLAHHRTSPSNASKPAPSPYILFTTLFLPLSLSAIASTSLPYLLAAHTRPSLLATLDDELDASTPCTVARRASIAQGLALLGLWRRSFSAHQRDDCPEAREALAAFSTTSKASSSDGLMSEGGIVPSGHFAPLFGAVTATMGIEASQAAYVFLFSHVRSVVSAAVRASVLGPYQAQFVLAGAWIGEAVRREVETWWAVGRNVDGKGWRKAGQTAPMMDLWGGRHELLYSRIFNS